MPPCNTTRLYQPIKTKSNSKTKSKAIVKAQAEKMGWQLKSVAGKPWTRIATKPFSQDKIEITFLKSGSVKITVPGKISPANHTSAELFLMHIQKELGASVQVTQMGAGATHSHGGLTHTHA